MSELMKNIDGRTKLAGTNKLEILLFTLGDMGQGNFCLKIGTKKYKMAFFFVTVQFR